MKEKKKIHIYTQYYFPVSNACSNRIEKYILALKDEYHIKIITWMPNYPTWIKEKKYKWRLFKKEIWQYSEKIIRTYEIATKNEWTISRLLNYSSFMISSFLYGLFTKKPDVIIVTSPPLFTAIWVLLLHKIKKIPYILEIRDLWPESVVALWYMKKDSLSYKIFHYLELSLYKNASKIIWVTEGIVDFIKNLKLNNNIYLQYNISEKIENIKNNPYLEFQDLIKWRKITLFAWNMNEAYDFKKAFNYIKDNNDIFFIFIWDWSEKEKFENKTKNLENILFLERKNKKLINEFIYHSDKILVPLKDEKFYKWTFPVKWIEWIVNNKEIIFFWPKNWEFNSFLDSLKNWKVSCKILEMEYFINT